jgi:hypothetical protein
MPTCTCGKTVDDWRGARGHVQFTEGGPHGPKGEVPDDWRELFDEGEDEATDEEADEGGQQADADGATDEEVREAVEGQESDSGQSEPSESNGLSGRLRKALTDDVRHLWGGA